MRDSERGSKPLFVADGEIKSPPMSESTRLRVGFFLRLLQEGELVPMPHSRPLPQIDHRCHELRIREGDTSWRVVYSIEPEAIVVLATFRKKDRRIPERVRERVRELLRDWRR